MLYCSDKITTINLISSNEDRARGEATIHQRKIIWQRKKIYIEFSIYLPVSKTPLACLALI